MTLTLARVLALAGGLALLGAFFMPWFSTQGLLLSGQFLHLFLSSSSPSDLRRFIPGSSGTSAEAQALRALVDMFPVCGALAVVAALGGGLVDAWRRAANVLLAVSGAAPLAAWAGGVSRLPTGANAELGLWLIPGGAIAILVGLVLDRPRARASRGAASPG
jgi:hypothetical protein